MAWVGSKKEAIISEKLIMNHYNIFGLGRTECLGLYPSTTFGNTQTAIGTRESDL